MSEIYFYKGMQNILDPDKNEESLKKIQEAFLKVLDNKNLSFLLGSGCSSYEIEKKVEDSNTSNIQKEQIGIPTMAPMAQEFYESTKFKETKECLSNKS